MLHKEHVQRLLLGEDSWLLVKLDNRLITVVKLGVEK